MTLILVAAISLTLGSVAGFGFAVWVFDIRTDNPRSWKP